MSPELLHDVTDVRGEVGALAADPPERMLFEYANGPWSTPSGEPTISDSSGS